MIAKDVDSALKGLTRRRLEVPCATLVKYDGKTNLASGWRTIASRVVRVE
jgi:hypothetical protein